MRSQAQSKGELCFPARNFLLDEGVVSERADTYHRAAGVGFADGGAWISGHQDYLSASVRLEQTRGVPKVLDPRRHDRCPETFRHESAFRAHGEAFSKLRLVRVVDMEHVAQEAGISLAMLAETSREVLAAEPSEHDTGDVLARMDDILVTWGEQCDLRPIWATALQDHADLFAAAPADDRATWADELRDRLGLSHLGPVGERPRPILVFRYPVEDIPRLKDSEVRPLAVPTVLDGALSPAFCPAPEDETLGRVVHLSGSEEPPASEIVHPFFVPRAKHLFRVGKITRPAPKDFARARARHLLHLRQKRADYADTTDADLLGAAP